MTKRYKYTEWNEWDEMPKGSDGKPKRFRRNKIEGRIGGVCAGIGDYIGLDHIIVRILTVASFFLIGPLTFMIYFGLWIFVPKDKRAPYRREYREYREARAESPDRPARTASFRDVKSKFRSLETRLADLERSITSSEWQLRRDFRDLEN
ncbi:MAG: PspC domain-containing protein [Robiginitomaculum sp.]